MFVIKKEKIMYRILNNENAKAKAKLLIISALKICSIAFVI
jgi:hypothetical protein